jgi:xanthine/CO dehydrogenase XdhC/CoxF family maturation factor
MKEIRGILERVAELRDGETAVLATVVDLQGSGYRLPGARMLITAGGDAVGTVSGGCLEADVLERAKRVLDAGRAEVFTYDTTADENSVFSLNMGCRGMLRILLEPVNKDSDVITALRKVDRERRNIEMATVIRSGSDPDVEGGQRIIVEESSLEIIGSRSLLKPVPQLHDDLLTFAGVSAGCETIRYQDGDAMIEFVFESLRPPVLLMIFGAGADAVPLADLAYGLGWKVRISDHRPAFVSRERFPDSEETTLLDRDAAIEIAADEMTAIVLMNHNYDRDKAMLRPALSSGAFYIGALGPRSRTDQILKEHRNDVGQIDESTLARLRSPAGLDIGGDSPETIALSILAEIQSVLKNRGGGPLRDRNGPIYDRK